MNEFRDPRDYRLFRSSQAQETIDALIEPHFLDMRWIGASLSRLGALPLMEEPIGSGQKVTTGNYSVRALDGFFITGSGVDKCNPKKQGLVYVEHVDHETGTMTVAGNSRPSREVLIHDMIYHTFPWVHVVLHTHDECALQYDNKSKRTDRPIFFAHAKDAEEVVSKLQDANYVILPEHGQFAIGESVGSALNEVWVHHEYAKSRIPFERIMKTVIGLSYAAMIVLTAAGLADVVQHREALNGKLPIPMEVSPIHYPDQ